MRLALASLVSASMAGCLFGGCGPTPSGATWADPGLFSTINIHGLPHGWSGTAMVPGMGLPFNATTKETELGGTLTWVHWTPFRDSTHRVFTRFSLVAPLDVRAEIPEDLRNESTALFERFAVEIGASQPDGVNWSQSFLESRGPSGAWAYVDGRELQVEQYKVALQGEVDLEAVLARIQPVGGDEPAIANDSWSFEFDLPSKTLTRETPRTNLSVDAAGATEYARSFAELTPDAEVLAAIAQDMTELGLAVPPAEEVRILAVVC